jgi:hypothetical protein
MKLNGIRGEDVGIYTSGLEQGPSVGCCEHSSESSRQ